MKKEPDRLFHRIMEDFVASLEIWTFVHKEKRNHGRYLSDMWSAAYQIGLWQIVLRRAGVKTFIIRSWEMISVV